MLRSLQPLSTTSTSHAPAYVWLASAAIWSPTYAAQLRTGTTTLIRAGAGRRRAGAFRRALARSVTTPRTVTPCFLSPRRGGEGAYIDPGTDDLRLVWVEAITGRLFARRFGHAVNGGRPAERLRHARHPL